MPCGSGDDAIATESTSLEIEPLADRGVGFTSLTEAIDTTTSGGKLIFSIFGALAEFSVISTHRNSNLHELGAAA